MEESFDLDLSIKSGPVDDFEDEHLLQEDITDDVDVT